MINLTLQTPLCWLASLVMIAGVLEIAPISRPQGISPVLAQTQPSPQQRLQEADRLFQQGMQFSHVNRHRDALEAWEAALEIYRDNSVRAAFPTASRAREGATLGNLGTVYFSLGQYIQAATFFQQDLAIAREVNDRAEEGRALGNLGVIYLQNGHYQQAIDMLEQRLTIAQEVGDRLGEEIALGNLGTAHVNLGHYQQALDLFQRQYSIARQIGDRTGEESALDAYALTYLYWMVDSLNKPSPSTNNI